ncbi:carbamoyl phosphate synthase large subunit [Lactobacillus sp. ESL0785]|uniref:carbamoyl phosphate synthase large subunit n=1 Tax=Lactobacillus sp. ESL0785 TaxID=2983232 RepID=UPI0023F7F302|nr:carbamoyl phosphate synthase large subunit [Lactobacillus sp. ESL0785]WEV70162.1 carbamoyl phosphate synthase large subunit [Lactobacillus sp. ESL0785]
MPLENDLDKILIIGSGPTLVGSVAETDLLTADAIKALLEEDIHVVLVNPNPATISTDKQPGVTVYLEPMTLDFLKRIIRMEEPDAIISAYGSTMGLKVTRELVKDGILAQMGIKLLTLNEQTLMIDSHQKMVTFLKHNGIEVNHNWRLTDFAATNFKAELDNKVNFPILLVKNEQYLPNKQIIFSTSSELVDYLKKERQAEDFSYKHYRLTEDLSSWEEIIVNVIRDNTGNVLFTDFADSLEPVAINSGDSAAIIPALTLNNDQIQQLRQIAQKIAASLNMIGILNIHFAVKRTGTRLAVKILTIKPRLTRSALWSQQIGLISVGYLVCKIAIGYRLNEVIDPMSGLNAAIEPVQDKVAIRMPYWSLTQAGTNHYFLGKRMQASGEAIGIGRNFETAFLKGLSSTINLNLALQVFADEQEKTQAEILADLLKTDELHLIRLLAAIAQGVDYAKLQELIHLHPVYFQKLQNIVKLGQQLQKNGLDEQLLLEAKKCGFNNELIAAITGSNLTAVQTRLKKMQLTPAYLQIDGSAGIYQPQVHAYYSSFGVQNEVKPLVAAKKVLIIGMLPSQVSVTSEFDYMISHAIKTLHNNNYATVLVSNNDESVATSYQDADRVYFDPITVENIVNIAHKENIQNVLLQFSGKKINALGDKLVKSGLNILGNNSENPIDKIKQILAVPLKSLKQNPLLTTTTKKEGLSFIQEHGFPILIGGFNNQGIKEKSAIVYDMPALQKYLTETQLSKATLSHFIEGNKYELTAISDGQDVTIPGIIEHLEQTGSHASDSIAVFRPQNLSKTGRKRLTEYAIELVKRLKMRGIFTLHFLIVEKNIYLLQIKPYAGHNVAFLSQSLGKDITACATAVLIGQTIADLDCKQGLWHSSNFIHVKMPVFSYINYNSGNTFDSKMKSSGSVMGRDTELAKALYKGYEASGLHIPSFGTIFISVRDEDKKRVTELAQGFYRLGFKIVATEGTANAFAEAGITTEIVTKVHTDPNNLIDKIRQHKIMMVINITNLSDTASEDAIRIRDAALNTHIPVFSSIETAGLILHVLESLSLTTQPI